MLSRQLIECQPDIVFFFQAEDGIRDPLVTGVQTCALPIFCGRNTRSGPTSASSITVMPIATIRLQTGGRKFAACRLPCTAGLGRSEERRVGEECGWRCWGEQ